MSKFETTFCSQCGREFGPGNHGFSHCEMHQYKIDDEYVSARELIKEAAAHDDDFRADCIKQTSVAARILRERGYTVTEG